MRLLTLIIALFALVGVAYVSLSTPSSAAVFSDEGRIAPATSTR